MTYYSTGFTTKNAGEIKVGRSETESLTADKCLLSVPSKDENGLEKFKKVAVVELFFDNIYGVHIGDGEKNRRHSGQKRTYRMVSLLDYFRKFILIPLPIFLDHRDLRVFAQGSCDQILVQLLDVR